MNPHERVIAACGRLKVFPLPTVVLFPGTAAPLHIFEPRYRAMVKDALETDTVMALASVPNSEKEALDGDPRLLPILSAGIISLHEDLPDGRYNVVLTGICRVKLMAEHSNDKLYREVQAEPVVDSPVSQELELSLRRAVLELSAKLPGKVADTFVKVASRAKGGALADVVAATLVNTVDRRRELLEELDAERRVRQVLGEVTQVIARMKTPPSGQYMN